MMLEASCLTIASMHYHAWDKAEQLNECLNSLTAILLNQDKGRSTRLSSTCPKQPQPAGMSEDEYIREVGGETPEEDDNFGLVEMMLRALLPNQRKLIVEDRVPPLHVEFPYEPLLPSSNKELSMKWLQGAYAKSLTAVHNLRCVQLGAKEKLNEQDLARRLSPDREKSMQWWKSARIGDIASQRAKSIYPPDLLHTYRNVNPMQINLAYGKHHIAAGHGDLGVWLLQNSQGTLLKVLSSSSGYEAFPYAIACTEVLRRMLEDGAEVDSVLQVAYSSGWSLASLSDFRKALRGVLKAQSLPSEVNDTLMRWKESPNVELRISQKSWLQPHQNKRQVPANVLCKDDRIQVMHYMVSGRLLNCDVGSTTLFVLPPW